MRRLLFLIAILSILLSCSFNSKINKKNTSGKLSCVKRIYDSATKQLILPDYTPDVNIWYKDSLVIQENIGVKIVSDIDGTESWRPILLRYTFIDIATRSIYEYASFSDTATLLKQYYQPDTAQGTVWNFWGIHPNFSFKKSQPINDTTLDGITYKRFKKVGYFNNERNQVDSFYDVAYLGCNTNKPKMFTYDKPFSEEHGCPMVRHDAYGIGQPYVVSQILFLSDKLTAEEERVFKVWNKYAKEHPIKQQ